MLVFFDLNRVKKYISNSFIFGTMKNILLLVSIPGLIITYSYGQTSKPAEQYQCLPCGQECDLQTYHSPGKCGHCDFQLVKKSTVTFKTVSPETICDYISNHPSAVLLDVRTREEFEGNHEPDFGTLKNAINIPIGEINSRLPELQQYKNKEIIVFCSHSHRSPQVSYRLTQHGFKNVTNMDGGMSVLKDGTCKK
jgi:rhodanese-related sulfurtransferase/DNA-directed RNA polymerase subunit RPC12/RpoP